MTIGPFVFFMCYLYVYVESGFIVRIGAPMLSLPAISIYFSVYISISFSGNAIFLLYNKPKLDLQLCLDPYSSYINGVCLGFSFFVRYFSIYYLVGSYLVVLGSSYRL